VKLSEKGFADAPAIFRKVGTSAAAQLKEYQDGSPNPERRVLGGVLTASPIERDVTVNLVALRSIGGHNDEEGSQIRRYLLALALIAASTDKIDLFLREGCNLRFLDIGTWRAIPRRGEPHDIDLMSDGAQAMLLDYAKDAASIFKSDWPTDLVHKFDLNAAKKLLAKKTDDEAEAGN
jgi:CRISPR-associated protein Csb1